MSITRCRTVIGSLYGLMRNALGLNVATPLEAQELSCTVAPDRRLVVLGHEPIAGFARDHGTVADEAAMLALHTLDGATLLAEPTFVAPGDSCLRAADPGWRWYCITGHGLTLADWERRPLAGALSGLAVNGHTHTRAQLSDASVAGRALMGVATPTESSVPVIASDGSIFTTPVADLGGGGSSSQLWAAPCVQMWYDTANLPPLGVNGVAADAEAVVALGDLSRYGRAVTQGTAGNRPTWSATESAIKFAANTAQYLAARSSMDPNSTGLVGDFTLYVVARRSATSGMCLYFGSAADNYRINCYWYEGSITCVVGVANASIAYIPTTNWTLIEIRWRGTACSLYANGSLIGTSTATHAHDSKPWANWRVGVYNTTQPIDLYLRQLVLLDAGATDAYCASVRAALLPS